MLNRYRQEWEQSSPPAVERPRGWTWSRTHEQLCVLHTHTNVTTKFSTKFSIHTKFSTISSGGSAHEPLYVSDQHQNKYTCTAVYLNTYL